jgi:predicted PilT family ATPase
MDRQVKLVASEEKDISEVIEEKGKDLKKILKEMDAKIEHWKFSMEETKEGRRVEVHITALFKSKPKKDE